FSPTHRALIPRLYPLSLHDALPISYTVAGNTTSQTAESNVVTVNVSETGSFSLISTVVDNTPNDDFGRDRPINAQANSTVDFTQDRKSTRLNSSHVSTSYAVFCSNK